MTTFASPTASPALNGRAAAHRDFHDAVLQGLSQHRKQIPCKFLYDERGSSLFDQICNLPEYYPTRTELRIMRRYGAQMASALGRHCLLVEYGSGSSLKTRILLDHLQQQSGYVPIDISREHLIRSSADLAKAYPTLCIQPVCSDYTLPFDLPELAGESRAVAAYFPGSTIGNFEPDEAIRFLKSVRRQCGSESGLLIGVDVKKDPAVLHAAYNDAEGVTAQFNLNLLRRINLQLDGSFDLSAFHHHASYNPRIGRIEMHLVAAHAQEVSIAGEAFFFEDGECIHTENCYKYTLVEFEKIASAAGYRTARVWMDEQKWFSVQLLVPA